LRAEPSSFDSKALHSKTRTARISQTFAILSAMNRR
jgi:hypothetical protein